MHRHHPHFALAVLLFALHLHRRGGHVGDEALQIALAAAFGLQRLGQEGVQRLLGLASQAGQDARAHGAAGPVGAAQQPGIGVERRTVTGLAARRSQEIPRRSPLGPLVGALQEPGPQRGFAPIGQGIEAVLVDVAEGAAQQGRQGQVVAGE